MIALSIYNNGQYLLKFQQNGTFFYEISKKRYIIEKVMKRGNIWTLET